MKNIPHWTVKMNPMNIDDRHKLRTKCAGRAKLVHIFKLEFLKMQAGDSRGLLVCHS